MSNGHSFERALKKSWVGRGQSARGDSTIERAIGDATLEQTNERTGAVMEGGICARKKRPACEKEKSREKFALP